MILFQAYNKDLNRGIAIIFIVILSIIIPIFFLKNWIIIVSFQFLVFSILFHFWKSINSKYLSISNLFINIFYIHFLLFAPLTQLSFRDNYLVNTFPIDPFLIFYTNILLSIFILTTTVVYFNSQKHKSFIPYLKKKDIDLKLNENLLKFIFVIFFILLVPSFINEISQRLDLFLFQDQDTSSNSSIQNLIWSKVIKIIPLYFLLAFTFVRKFKMRLFWQFLALLLIILAKNPIVEHRNGFGASIAAAFFILILPSLRKIKIRRLYLVSIFSFPVLFAAGVFLAPHRYKQDSFFKEIFSSYNSIHFDAWSNFCAGIAFVHDQGFYYGSQIISAIFFWIPRSFWVNKGSGTGQDLGDYLMQTEQLWFNNISSILPLEGYVDFGFFGILIFSFILGKVLFKTDSFLNSSSFISRSIGLFLSCSIIFIYRGPFLSSFAFTFGGVLGLLLTHYFVKSVNSILVKSGKK
jgi:oligosaccharide repeat unit polymerase